ncbi:MAG TPA: xanthine dehydrogenase family protein subunit M [Magnetovibrio sp.]
MKPAKFTYHTPESLEEAFQLLEEYGEEAKIIAGGQSLIPVMNLRLAQPEHIVDINGLTNLAGIRVEGQRIVIGALTRHADVLESALVREHCAILNAAAARIGHLAIRNRGTIGGSLSNADPAAEWSMMAIALDAEMTIQSARGSRTVRASDFIQSVYTVDLEADEILTEISFPNTESGEGWSIQQICRRAGDFAIVQTAATVRLDAAGNIERLRLAVGSMGPTPLRLDDVEQAAVGRSPDAAWIAAVSETASRLGDPESDVHASAEYRREVCAVLTAKALNEALASAGRKL